jgi:type II secretory pathway pseudopilin PulG
MPSGEPLRSRRSTKAGGFALPILLLVLAVGAIAATQAEIPLGYRMAREREQEFEFRASAYVAAIRSFYLAEEDVRRRRLPTSFAELERDPRFAQKRHIRRLYSDPLAAKPETPFREVKGSPGPGLQQGVIGVASTSDRPLLRRAGWATNGEPSPGAKAASDLQFQVDLKELTAPIAPNTPALPLPLRPKADAKTHKPSRLQ